MGKLPDAAHRPGLRRNALKHGRYTAEAIAAAGALVGKIFERRATLLGLNAPQSAAVQIIEHTAPPAMSSTERIYAAIQRVVAMKNGSANGEDRREQGESETEPK